MPYSPSTIRSASKRLSFVLRHNPGSAGITLQEGGWVPVDELLAKMKLSRDLLDAVVEQNDKQRFLILDGRIRASQGHSVEVDLGYEDAEPPEVLYHGTYRDAVASILRDGLQKRARHAVHLSASTGTAESVGSRRGAPVLLRVRAREMSARGHTFQVSQNGVWLTDAVPPEFIDVIESGPPPR